MQLWKLGCRWGSDTPLFYDFIRENNIVIGWIDKDYSVDDWLLITDGHTVLAIAKVLEQRSVFLNHPKFKDECNDLELPFGEDLFLYPAKVFVLKPEDQFSYPLQQGIVKVQGKEYINKFNELRIKYMNQERLFEIINILKYKKQIILQGPPGTGKTKLAKELAVQLLNLSSTKELENQEQFNLIQFHPSFSYEDFVRGIVAEADGSAINYKTVNKMIGLFAKSAFDNYKLSQLNNSSIQQDNWIENSFSKFKNEIEIDVEQKEIVLSGQITLFRVDKDSFRHGKQWTNVSRINFGDFKKLIKAVLNGNLNIDKNEIPFEISVHAYYRSTYYLPLLKMFFSKYKFEKSTEKPNLKNYILIIDEINRANLSSVLGELIYALEYRGESVKSMYAIEGNDQLNIPPNLYIIGTMNTADRSVGSIDYAIRRRFAFVDVLPNDLTYELGDKFNSSLFEKVALLFDSNLSGEFKKKDVQLGHSYFIDKSEEGGSMDIRLNYEIKPILLEYVKDGILIGEGIEKKIEDLTA